MMRVLPTVHGVLFVAFAPLLVLACSDSTSPGPSELIVITSTAGIDPDEDGYLLSLDGQLRTLLAPNGEFRIADLEPGEHVVRIEGQLPSCAIEGQNPRTVVIARGAPTTARFTVTCAARFGYIDVGASTTGQDRDAGYMVTLNDEPGRRVNAVGELTYGPLLPGEYTVRLNDVSSNCVVAGGALRTLTIVAGATADLEFAVSCTAFAAIRVTAATTGLDRDVNNYLAYASNGDGGYGTATVPNNGSATVDSLAAGTYTLALFDIAANCDATPETRTVTLAPGDTARLTFDIACIAARQLVYTGDVVNGSIVTSEIYVARINGADARRLTTNQFQDGYPSWGPDGRIAFSSNRSAGNTDIYVMNADGSNPVRLTTADAVDNEPVWSPDGLRIAFVSQRDGNAEIYVMNADGSNPVRLTSSTGRDNDPAWSPDGTRIAFSSGRDGNDEIYVMTAGGTGVTRLTRNATGDFQPTWSPDGTRIAFTRSQDGAERIVVMSSDGVGETVLPAYGSEPSWSPDGNRIAFAGTIEDYYYYGEGTVAVLVIRPDGTYVGSVANSPSYSPGWRP